MNRGEMEITIHLTIDATSLAGGFTLDAGHGADGVPATGDGFRIFRIDDGVAFQAVPVELRGLTLTGGDVAGQGGAILSLELLRIQSSSISGNHATTDGGAINSGRLYVENSTLYDNSAAAGGAIRAVGNTLIENSTLAGNEATVLGGGAIQVVNFPATIRNSTISGNSAPSGGGIHADDVTLHQSTVSNNVASNKGGGVFADNATLTQSTVSGNSATLYGGGVYVRADATLTGSTVSGNFARRGGGVYSFGASSGEVTVLDSTISGNLATLFGGGGIYTFGDVTLTQSTISGNSAQGGGGGIATNGGNLMVTHSTVTGNSTGNVSGGIYTNYYSADDEQTIRNSIIAGNSDNGTAPDVRQTAGSLTVTHSLIGDNTGSGLAPAPVGSPDGNGNLVGTVASPIDPMLDLLADNGGPTATHALLPGSPALDMGDPAAVAGSGGVPEFDQRGAGFPRVANGRIDIGAFELQIVPPALPGDYNQNDTVGAADYVMWRKLLGTTGVPPFSGADGDGDGDITPDDYGVWTTNFGDSLPGSGSALVGQAMPDKSRAVPVAMHRQAQPDLRAIDAAFAVNAARAVADTPRRPAAVPRLAAIDAPRIDLLLADSTIAKAIEGFSDSRPIKTGDPSSDDDATTVDAAFERLADLLAP